MTYSTLAIFYCFATIYYCSGHFHFEGDSSFENVYFDLKSRLPFRLSSIENMLINGSENSAGFQMISLKSVDIISNKTVNEMDEIRPFVKRLGFRSNGCTCQQLSCGCCLGINVNQFNFHREGCMNFTYDPEDFAVTMEMLMDENAVFSNSFSAKNPPPLCIPVPIPYIPIQIETCARVFDIYTPGQNLHMCFDFEARIQKATVLVLHFDCMRMGNDGIAHLKPGEPSGITPSTTSTTTENVNQVDSDVFDPIYEYRKEIKENMS